MASLSQLWMLSTMVERLSFWLLSGPAEHISLLGEAGMQAVIESLPAEVLAAQRAVLHCC
jgi:hypothetical protein